MALVVFARAVGPLEDQGEDQRFDAGHERRYAEVEIVVSHRARWVEEFAIQEVENQLCMESVRSCSTFPCSEHLRLEVSEK